MIAKFAGGLVAMFLIVACLPLLLVPGAGGPDVASACGDVDLVLRTIRTLESGGNYTAQAAGSSASGAYQYIDSTWQHWADKLQVDTGRYPSAWMATPIVQDSVATANVHAILNEHDGDISMVPLVWYYPPAVILPALRDVVPVPEAGNTLTPNEYQARWMTIYQGFAAEQGEATAAAGCSGTISPDGNWALPAPKDALARAGITSPHHDYPAVDLMMPEGTPVFALTAGTVVRTTHFPHNWWTAGCASSRPPTGCATCGMGITIETATGMRVTYCHNRLLYTTVGDNIAAGQHIADSGDTGRSGAPHLHLELRINNTQHCPQRLLAALYNADTTLPAPANLPTTGCTF